MNRSWIFKITIQTLKTFAYFNHFRDQYFPHIETSQLICHSDQVTGFCVKITLVIDVLRELPKNIDLVFFLPLTLWWQLKRFKILHTKSHFLIRNPAISWLSWEMSGTSCFFWMKAASNNLLAILILYPKISVSLNLSNCSIL